MTEENGIPTRTDLADIPEQTPEDKRKRDEVEECMRDVIDPELGINVVDLGLVYSIWIENGVDAHIEMTLTSPACPLTDVWKSRHRKPWWAAAWWKTSHWTGCGCPPWGAEHDHRGRAGTIARPRLQRLVPEGSRVPFTPQIC